MKNYQGSPFMILKIVAGILLILIGVFALLFTWILNSGHTSSAMSKRDDIILVTISTFFLVGGICIIKFTTNRNINK